ncbi:MAG TPA: amino acid permease [Chitinophagaceae bacterium]|nr:amino acid permease [Chitinophagaceae bacterium]
MEKDKENDPDGIQLSRVLNVQTATLVVAGTMIGAGVFKKIVPMAATGLSETYILLVWVAAGIITLFGAFTFAGLSKLTTASGGAYEYLRICYNELVAFLLGWGCFAIIGSGAIAALAFIFAESVNALITIPDPLQHLSHVSIAHVIYPFADSGIKIAAVISIMLLTWYNYLGVKKAAGLNNIITGAKISGILFLIIAGLFISNHPVTGTINAAPLQTIHPSFGIFFSAMLSAFWAYDGFSNVSAATGEIKNPKRNVGIAIVAGVCIVMILYVLTNYAYMKAIPLQELALLGENKIAASEVAGKLLGNGGCVLISILIVLSTFGALNVLILLYSRLYYRMAEEKFFFKSAAKVHPVYRTPHFALFYSMIWSCILVLSGTFDILTNIVVFTAFAFYTLLAAGLIKMKTKKIITERISFYPVAPVLFIIITLFFLINTLLSNTQQTLTGIILIASGIPFYYFFKYKKYRE